MFFYPEDGGLESVDRMTRGTLSSLSPFCKLAIMCILVAIRALGEGDRLLEIADTMALFALYRLVLSEQRIFGLRVIEALVYAFDGNPLPSGCVVTRLARLRKAAVVRIIMAVRAFTKGNAGISWLVVGPRSMALCASDLPV